MTTPESLGLIDALEAQNSRSAKRARQTVWGSVAFALAVLLFLIVSASLQLLSVKKDVKAAEKQLGIQQRALQDVESARLSAERSLAQAVEQQRAAEKARDEAAVERSNAQKEAESFRRIVQNVPKEEVLKAVTTAQAKAPGKPLAPRIYAQIVREQDRAYAARMSKVLTDEGYLVLGIEYVARPYRPLTHTEVRFYKDAELEEAQRIVEVLQGAGESKAKVRDLNLDHNKKVRPNHFEVWFAPQVP